VGHTSHPATLEEEMNRNLISKVGVLSLLIWFSGGVFAVSPQGKPTMKLTSTQCQISPNDAKRLFGNKGKMKIPIIAAYQGNKQMFSEEQPDLANPAGKLESLLAVFRVVPSVPNELSDIESAAKCTSILPPRSAETKTLVWLDIDAQTCASCAGKDEKVKIAAESSKKFDRFLHVRINVK
jgi:hypothetical protein